MRWAGFLISVSLLTAIGSFVYRQCFPLQDPLQWLLLLCLMPFSRYLAYICYLTIYFTKDSILTLCDLYGWLVLVGIASCAWVFAVKTGHVISTLLCFSLAGVLVARLVKSWRHFLASVDPDETLGVSKP